MFSDVKCNAHRGAAAVRKARKLRTAARKAGQLAVRKTAVRKAGQLAGARQDPCNHKGKKGGSEGPDAGEGNRGLTGGTRQGTMNRDRHEREGRRGRAMNGVMEGKQAAGSGILRTSHPMNFPIVVLVSTEAAHCVPAGGYARPRQVSELKAACSGGAREGDGERM